MRYDVIIIGAGPGGFETAKILGKAGKKVALVEKDQVGGICLNRGCIPAKTTLYSAEMFRIGKKIKNYGIRFCQDVPGFDFDAMIKHRAEIMNSLRENWVDQIENVGVDMIYGWAELTGDNTVEVDGKEYEADYIVLATGGGIILSKDNCELLKNTIKDAEKSIKSPEEKVEKKSEKKSDYKKK